MEIEINLYNLTNINTEGKQTVNNTKKKRNKIEKNGTITEQLQKTVVALFLKTVLSRCIYWENCGESDET